MRVIDAHRDYWPPAVSNGLSLPCHDCGRHPVVGFIATDDEWARVVPDEPARLSVLCLHCFVQRGGDVTALEELQVIGGGTTALFHPGRAYSWGSP